MPSEGARCLFCGGDASEPNHSWHCDGQQGHVEAEALPLLASGLTTETHATSMAAAISVLESKDTQRELVRMAIVSSGGLSDFEVQEQLGLDGDSERPRRWELWKLGRIKILRDAEGHAVKRLTRNGRRAVVWVAA